MCVFFQTSKATKDIGAIQKGADFVKAYALGFDVNVSSMFLLPVYCKGLKSTNPRTPLRSYDWMIYTSIHSKSKMSKLYMAIIFRAQSDALRGRMERQNSR